MLDLEIHSSRGHCDHRDRYPEGNGMLVAMGVIFALAFGAATCTMLAEGPTPKPAQAPQQVIYFDVNNPACEQQGDATKALACAAKHAKSW